MAKSTLKQVTNRAVARQIAEADTVEKVWALVAALTGDGQQYPAETYLANVKAYARLAQGK